VFDSVTMCEADAVWSAWLSIFTVADPEISKGGGRKQWRRKQYAS